MSSICKYYLTNSCRYGERCRFNHVLPHHYPQNPYVYDAREKNEGVSIMQRISSQQTKASNMDDFERLIPEYLKKIAEEINQIEVQHMWPLTCYSFSKQQGNLPGWIDWSMEEIRWEAYQANSSGNTHVYLAHVQELLNRAKELRSVLLRPSKQGEDLVREYMKGNGSANYQSPEYKEPYDQRSKTINSFSFVKAPSFEKTQPHNTSGFFSPLPQNSFHQIPQSQYSIFGGKSSFDSPQQTASGVFPPIQDSTSGMEVGSSIFSSTQMQPHFFMSSEQRPNEEIKTANSPASLNVTMFSRIDELSKQDYEAFKATTFTLENLPLVPPPKELCQ